MAASNFLGGLRGHVHVRRVRILLRITVVALPGHWRYRLAGNRAMTLQSPLAPHKPTRYRLEPFAKMIEDESGEWFRLSDKGNE